MKGSSTVDQTGKFPGVPEWSSLRERLESVQTPSEKQFRPSLSKGLGAASPLHDLRLIDEAKFSEQDVRVVFYRDSASWCPYCQKVWMMLEEKGIPYKVERINMRCYGDKPRSFSRLQPSGAIPVATIDGVTYRQSNDIMEVLEKSFPSSEGYKSVAWKDSEQDDARRLLALERKIFSAWMYWLTGGDRGGRMRGQFVQTLEEVEFELNRNRDGKGFFMGDRVTIVDFMYASFLERMAASLLYYKGFQMRHSKDAESRSSFPALNRWFDAMETLPSYQVTKSDYYTHCWDLPPQLGGCVSEPDGKPFAKVIDGERTLDGSGSSWALPLQRHSGGIEPDWDWCGGDDENMAKREAVERLLANSQNIVKFASRGSGKQGIPGFMAPLSDPNATSDDAVQASVDAVLRTVCLALLEGYDADSTKDKMVEVAETVSQGGRGHVDGVLASVAYLRDRVGVPRDMQLPAARQLRAHLNWALEFILDD